MEYYLDKKKQLWQKVAYCTLPTFVLENIQTQERKYVPVNILANREEYKRFIEEEQRSGDELD